MTTRLSEKANLNLSGDKTGHVWDVVLIGAKPDKSNVLEVDGERFIVSANRRLYPVAMLAESYSLWDGAKVYDNHLTQEEFYEKAGRRSAAKEWLGTITGVRWDSAAEQLVGRLSIVEDAIAKKLLNAYNTGVIDSVGLSIDAIADEPTREVQKMPVIPSFTQVLSVDFVSDPAAGGAFTKIIESKLTTEESVMTDSVNPTAEETQAQTEVQTTEAAPVTLDQVRALIKQMMSGDKSEEMYKGKMKGKPKMAEKAEKTSEGTELDVVAEVENEALKILESLKRRERQLVLAEKLSESKLPPQFQAIVKAQFDNKTFTPADVDGAIERVKEAFKAVDTSGQVRDAGVARTVEQVFDEADKAQIAFMQSVVPYHLLAEWETSDDTEVRNRLPEAYLSWVKAGRGNLARNARTSEVIRGFFGGNNPLLDGYRAEEAVTLSAAIENTVNIWIANDYSQRERWWEQLVTIEEVNTIDEATLVREYGIDTLPIVAKGAAYTELDMDDDRETASFVKHGGTIAVAMEDLMLDKVGAFRRIPRLLADTWYNTISQKVASVFTVNSDVGPVLSDGAALFNATVATTSGGHANLGTTALNYGSYDAAYTAMRNQTTQKLGAGQKALLRPKFLLVPTNLRNQALNIYNSPLVPNQDATSGTNLQTANTYYQDFTIVEVPNWTDTNNWAIMADPRAGAMSRSIWLIFPRGQRVPSIFTANNETTGLMFTNDTMQYKVRMMTYQFSSTYDCAPVSDFRPLYKANVA